MLHMRHFFFTFITKVLNKKKEDENCNAIKQLRKELCQSEEVIKITDFGAGSSINNQRHRKVQDVAKNSAKNAKFESCFIEFVNFLSPIQLLS